MTPLAKFMHKRGWSDQDLAAFIGRDRTTASRLRRGVVSTSLEIAVLLERESRGRVPVASLLKQAQPEAA